jgi:DNA replication protein DnaC
MTDAQTYQRVQTALQNLKFITALDGLDALAQQAATADWTYLDFLDRLTQAELTARTERDVTRNTRRARLPFLKTLDQFDFAFQPSVNEKQIRDLATLRFVAHGENVLLLGPPGVGKTHLAVSLGMAALLNGKSVLFYSVVDLLDQLAQDAKADRLQSRLKALCQPEVLILDELGYFPLDKRAAQFLFQGCKQRLSGNLGENDSRCRDLIPLATQIGSACFSNVARPRFTPSRPGDLQPFQTDLFTAAFHRARTDLETQGAELGVA